MEDPKATPSSKKRKTPKKTPSATAKDSSVVKDSSTTNGHSKLKSSSKKQSKEQNSNGVVIQEIPLATKELALPRSNDDSDGKITIEGVVENKASSLYCCRPAFLQPKSTSSLVFNQEPPVLLCGSGVDVRGAGVRTGNWLWNLSHHDKLNGNRSKQHSITNANVKSSSELLEADDHEVTALAVSGDGNYIVTGSIDGVLSIWTSRQLYLENKWHVTSDAASEAGPSSRYGSGFIKTCSRDLGAPIHTLSTTPSSNKQFHVILARPFMEDAVAADKSKQRDWSVATLALNTKGTKYQCEVVYTSPTEIFGMGLFPAPLSDSAIESFNETLINNKKAEMEKKQKEQAASSSSSSSGKNSKKKKEPDNFGDDVVHPIDMAVITARGIDVCCLKEPSLTCRGQTQKRPRPKRVQYAEDHNFACCISVQPKEDFNFANTTTSSTQPATFSSSVGLATGHIDGQIYIWYGLFDRNSHHISDPKPMAKSSEKNFKRKLVANDRGSTSNALPFGVRRLQPLHWHSGPVTALCWSLSGYLLSGGHEAVLLVWRLNVRNGIAQGSSGKPEFLPRLGGSVSHICLSPDHNAASVSTTNNVVRLISLSNRERVFALKGLSMSLGIKQNKQAAGNGGGHLSSLNLVSASTSYINKMKLKKSAAKKMLLNNDSQKNEEEEEEEDIYSKVILKGNLGNELCEDSNSLSSYISLMAMETCQHASYNSGAGGGGGGGGGYDAAGPSSLPTSSCRLLLNGHPGMVQFVDIISDSVDPVPLEVFPQNFNVMNQFQGPNSSSSQHAKKKRMDGNSTSMLQLSDVEKSTPTPVVTHCCYANDGKYLITVDSWKTTKIARGGDNSSANKTSAERAFELENLEALKLLKHGLSDSEQTPNLKFWQLNSVGGTKSGQQRKQFDSSSSINYQQGRWILNSALASPHGVFDITCITTSTNNPTTASSSDDSSNACLGATGAQDGSVKIWKLIQTMSTTAAAAAATNGATKQPYHGRPSSSTSTSTTVLKMDEKWVCESTINYHHQSISSLCFCEDNSILAAGSGSNGLISLWNPNSATLLRTLIPPFLTSSPLMMHQASVTAGAAYKQQQMQLQLKKYDESGFKFFVSSKNKRKLEDIEEGGRGVTNSIENIISEHTAKTNSTNVDNGYGVVYSSAFLSPGKEAQAIASYSSSSCSAEAGVYPLGSTKLFFATPSSFGVWDMMKCEVDYSYFMTVDGAAFLPPNATPFVFDTNLDPNTVPSEENATTRTTSIRSASFAIATSISSKLSSANSSSSSSNNFKSCVSLFSTLQSSPVYMFYLKSKVKSMQFVLSDSGEPLGIAVLNTNLSLQFLSIKKVSGKSSDVANKTPSSADLSMKNNVLLRKPIPLSFNTKKVKFSQSSESEDIKTKHLGDGAVAATVGGEPTISGLLKHVPSSELPQVDDLFRAYFSSVSSSTTTATASTAVSSITKNGLLQHPFSETSATESDEEGEDGVVINPFGSVTTASASTSSATSIPLTLTAKAMTSTDQKPWKDFFKSCLVGKK